MKAFVLAAGFGTRRRPLTLHLPKPLVPVLNVPGLFYTFALLKAAGITEIICNIHHKAESIRRFIEGCRLPGLEITFSEEPEILGTGGGLKRCEKLLGRDDFLLVNSDIVTDIDFGALIESHRRSGHGGTLCLYETPEAHSIGTVGVEGGLVRDFAGRRGTGIHSPYVYTGSAVLGPEIFPLLESGFSSIVDTGFYGLVERERLGYRIHRGLWQDIGTLESYLYANLDTPAIAETLGPLLERTLGMRPCRISPEARIEAGAEVSDSVVGAGCVVESGCRLTHSVLLPGTVVETGTVLDDALADPYGATRIGESSTTEHPR